ncbi:Neurexin 1 [Carabus blaptoides fortunei]
MKTVAAIVLICAALVGLCPGFLLDGSANSYSQFRKWGVGTNGSLEFEFKTDQPNGLLLYTDDGGTYDFFEIKLVEGALRLRYNLGGGAQIITVGRDLNDGHWHKVHVQRNDAITTLSVDGTQQTSVSRGKEFQFGRFATNSEVFVGGMPTWYNTKLTLLALPSVIFEPRFVGAIRNLVYSDAEGGPPRRQETRSKDHKCGPANVGTDVPVCTNVPKSQRTFKGNGTDACETHDPCQHGGICISTDSGPICECRNADYEGLFCEKDKAPSEAVFRGTEFLSYDLSHTGGEPIVSAQDAVTFYFKTRQPNGLLFYTGDGTDYLNVAIRDGGLSLTMGLSNGKQEMVIKPNKVRFDDNQWHKVSVHRRIQEISSITSFCRLSTVVDGVYAEHSHIAGKFTMLSSSRVYVGGSINPRALPGSRVHNNFVGCMRKVEFVADTLRLNLIELGRTGSKLITVVGRLEFKCPEAEPGDPITFTTRDSHLILPPWNAKKTGTISFKFRTNEANGLIVYNGGIRPPRSDFFAVEVLNGHVYVHLDLGSGGVKVRASRRRVDDGSWHELVLRRTGRDGRVTVDGSPAEFVTTGDSNQLELDGPMYLGGMSPPFTDIVPPPALWTAVLRQGYVGCLRDFNVNNKPVDIAGFARQQDSGSIKTLCHIQPAQCPSQPCLNGGLCLEGWNRFICDCTDTIFTGPTCGKEAPTLNFNGTQHVEIIMDSETQTQTEDLILRFRTAKALGLLMTTNSEESADRIELSVAAGRVRLAVRLGDRDKILLAGQNVNDNEWHTVRFSRRASNLKLQLDSQSPIRAETVLVKKSTLQIQTIHLGGLYHPEEEIRMTTTVPNFIGSLQQFIFNGISYIDLARSASSEKTVTGMPQIRIAAKFITHSLESLHRPVTFRSKHTFVGLPMLRAYSTMHVDFMFKTREANGLIFFNGGRKQDFIAVELVDGHVNYVINVGDGPIRLRDNIRTHLNDNRWHTVSIRRPTPKQHTLMVDDDLVVATTDGSGNLELEGILYLGGLHKDLYAQLPQEELHSKHGFEGCLAGLDFNGESPNVLEDAVVHSSLVATGCEGQAAKCSHNVCANRGICVQQWHSYTCDCDMTSFTGPTCSDESVAYEFGPNRGIITYTFPEDRRPEMTEDSVALGFITTKSDAVLLRVVSGTSNDYIELEIVEGNVFMVYNMGTNDHPLGEISVKVNDNVYHVVRFRRSGANSTLQIDDFNVQTNHPTGHQLQVFNSQSQIQVGGKWNRGKSRVERPFTGILAGVVVNGMRVLDLAAEKDTHTSIRGDVQLMTGILERHDQKMQQTPASGFPGVMDDLVFSGAGSGCNEDDEDQCTPLFESGSGDDLITPVYVPPTRPPTTTPKISPGRKDPYKKENGKPCDDEDCALEGSGDGTTEDSTISTSGTESTHAISSSSMENSSVKVPDDIVDGTSETSATGRSDPTTDTDNTASTGSGSSETATHSSSGNPTDGTSTPFLTVDPSSEPPAFKPPVYYATAKPPRKRPERVTSEMSEIIALIIGIIAGALIAVILIILVILKFKSRGEHSYKVDDGKGYQQGPNAALLGNASNSNGQTQYQMNGTVRNGDKGAVLKKKRDSKDIKEWYV